ncbi:DUF177 domain-containing protein [Novosphingobium sp.]|uniref:YceD family protein n=1 Tax=Novosphingobium sp. TaxID=1874826 RepID=UPI0035B27065
MSEFSRPYDLRHLPAEPQVLEASAEECAALAGRFDLVRVDSLTATITLTPEGAVVRADGRIKAAIVQSCAVSGEDLPVKVDEPVALRFVPPGTAHNPDEEVELDADELDEIEMEAEGRFDLGEALAQSLALAIDPFAEGPQAEEARRKAGLLEPDQTGPFAALAALKKQLD